MRTERWVALLRCHDCGHEREVTLRLSDRVRCERCGGETTAVAARAETIEVAVQ